MTITGAQVKALRELLGWWLSKLAGRVGLNGMTIAQFESGDRRLPFFDASVISSVFVEAGVGFDEVGRGAPLRKGDL